VRRRVTDGAERTDTYDYPHDEATLIWVWAEGNLACDCNRELRFEMLGGEPLRAEMHADALPECSRGRYAVTVSADGRLVYADTGVDQ